MGLTMKKYQNFRYRMHNHYIFSVTIMLVAVIISKAVTGSIFLLLIDSMHEIFRTLYLLYSCLLDILVILVINTIFNKQKLSCLGIEPRIIEGYGKGIFCGVFLSILIMLIIYVGLEGELELNKNINFMVVFLIIIGFLIQATSEEILFRGYIQNEVEKSKTYIFAIIVQAVLFTSMHLLNAGCCLLSVVNLFLFSVILGSIRVYFKSIFIVSGIHFIWNTFMALIVDGKISGVIFSDYIFKFNFQGNKIITGGDFGIEGSIFVSIIFIVILGVLGVNCGKIHS